ncbi:glycosyltransferase family 8 protein [Sphingobacterium suaedae]|uniref:Glycosyltransferase family 8 protein n=1 Tax=Sphingobacterium suaedae TaxID=1686402 RepID=A0ABW5KLU0_9SPHI
MTNFAVNSIPIVLAFTPNYFVPAATCILSILKSAKSTDHFHFICLLTEPLSPSYMDKLVRLVGDSAVFSYINLEGALSDIYVDEKYTVAASYRLLLPTILMDYEKVLYVDCDMIFRTNLADLYRDTEMGAQYMAGVFEATLDFQEAYLESIGCQPGHYINSGLLVMNLHALREDQMVDKLLHAAKADYLEFPDQDVINQLCHGRIRGLPPYWNSIRTFWLPQYKAAFLKYYTEADWLNVQKTGNVHYTGAKPWNTFTIGFAIWWDHFEQLPAEVKELMVVPKGLYWLSKMYRNPVGRRLIDGSRHLYRRLRNR